MALAKPLKHMMPSVKRKHIFLATILLILAGLALYGARLEPVPANVLERNGITYSAAPCLLGCVEARSKKTGALFWCRQVYVIKYDYTLEQDVQDIWITTLEFQGDNILVTNERQDQYLLDTRTLNVTPVKGPLVIGAGRYMYP